MRAIWRVVEESGEEEGHAIPSLAALVAAIGVLGVGIGAANDTGWLALGGGIVGAVGIVAYMLAQHLNIDYDVYRRLERLEKPEE
jgi:hypothetical protein